MKYFSPSMRGSYDKPEPLRLRLFGGEIPLAATRRAENLSGFLFSDRAKLLNRSRSNANTGKMLAGLTGHRQTARKAAVTVLRGNGGTFPSQAQKSDPQGWQERAEGTHSKRVILPVDQCVKVNPSICPKCELTEQNGNPEPIYSGLGEYCRQRTEWNLLSRR